MARYIGDLTHPDNGVERQKVASMIDDLAEAVRDRRVRSLNIDYNRDIVEAGVEGIAPRMSPWTIGMDVTQRGRHEK